MSEISISYAITVHNESEYLIALFDRILRYKRPQDEIIVLDDYSDDDNTKYILEEYRSKVKLHQHRLAGDFASHKNYLKSLCTGTHLFQIDADEQVHSILIQTLPDILADNDVDLIRVARINIVPDVTPEYIQSQRWHLDERNFINFPDWQDRIMKNILEIKWVNKVHEKVIGHNTNGELPTDDEYCLFHLKSFERQVKQNEFYKTL